jgi:hypothetical protein
MSTSTSTVRLAKRTRDSVFTGTPHGYPSWWSTSAFLRHTVSPLMPPRLYSRPSYTHICSPPFVTGSEQTPLFIQPTPAPHSSLSRIALRRRAGPVGQNQSNNSTSCLPPGRNQLLRDGVSARVSNRDCFHNFVSFFDCYRTLFVLCGTAVCDTLCARLIYLAQLVFSQRQQTDEICVFTSSPTSPCLFTVSFHRVFSPCLLPCLLITVPPHW